VYEVLVYPASHPGEMEGEANRLVCLMQVRHGRIDDTLVTWQGQLRSVNAQARIEDTHGPCEVNVIDWALYLPVKCPAQKQCAPYLRRCRDRRGPLCRS
jgi:hypothetical protein